MRKNSGTITLHADRISTSENYSIAQTFPGHEMMIVTIFKNQILNVGILQILLMVSKEEVKQK